ncbi:glutathione S-transferase family protein [Methylobacterium iners]|uniref:Glutathione S-transferase GST-6.0 n=1 Tax=Methylobacterium iners TaxID=418707 RepID=A0ABQ4RX00_9HYPH|nr:glutathione S-transferase family protein [Methylobacterium iners]GJD94723.1 Glutathione S-transferase GST-6.0 [Methylobacterium iners]
MRIYGDLVSGNCLKVKIVADLVGLSYEWVPVDILKGESRTPDYLSRFPAGQVPGLELDDGRCLAQSNAIMRYLARDSALIPGEDFLRAKMDEWLFWEQYSHEPAIAVCRFEMRYLGKPSEARDPARVRRGEAALDLMERHLAGAQWMVGHGVSLADVALFAYTQWADEGGFDLTARPAIRAWLGRCTQALRPAAAD